MSVMRLLAVSVSMMALAAGASPQHRRDAYVVESGPKRVMLDDFIITISPCEFALTPIQGAAVRDVAEEIVKQYFDMYDWGPNTLYQYMGFTNVASVAFSNSESAIAINGGIVSFDGSSTEVPTHVEIQAMIQELLHPADATQYGLTEALQNTQDFSYVEESGYEIMWQPTPAPTVSPTDTEPEREEDEVTPIVSDSAPGAVKDSPSDSGSTGVIAGVIAGILMLSIAALLLVHRHRRREAAWRENAQHVHPQDDDLEEGVSKKALHTRDATAMSDAGSSRVGRLLSATAAAVQGGRGMSCNQSEATPPQTSSEESQDDEFSQFEGIEVIDIEPTIVAVHERFQVIEKEDMTLSTKDHGGISQWQGIPSPPGDTSVCLSTPTVVAPAALGPANFDQWNEVSSNHSQDLLSDNDQEEFTPDKTWDFDDCESDVVDDPFQTPDSMPVDDRRPLLQRMDACRLEYGQGQTSDLEKRRSKSLPPGKSRVYNESDGDGVEDPSQTPSDYLVDDEKPLLQHLGTYELENVQVTTDGSNKQHRRTLSAPCEFSDSESAAPDNIQAKPHKQYLRSYISEKAQGSAHDLKRRRSKSLPPGKSRDYNERDGDGVEDPSQTPSICLVDDEKPLLRHLGTYELENVQVTTDGSNKQHRRTLSAPCDFSDSESAAPDNIQAKPHKPLLRYLRSYISEKAQGSAHDLKRRRSKSLPSGKSRDYNERDGDGMEDPSQTPSICLVDDEKPLLQHLGTYELENAQVTRDDSNKRHRRTLSAPCDFSDSESAAPDNIQAKDHNPLLRHLSSYISEKVQGPTHDLEMRRATPPKESKDSDNVPVNDEKPLLQQLRSYILERAEKRHRRSKSEPSVNSCDLIDCEDDDPFVTPEKIPVNDDEPLLQQLGSYQLEKLQDNLDKNQLRRIKSAPRL